VREAHVPFLLGGSVAAWARGGPEPDSDLDLMVPPAAAGAALEALAAAGLRPERPPEEWLCKAWHGDVLVDVIFRPPGIELTEEVIQRAATISVMAIATPVMALEDVLVTMLCALDEHARAHQPIAVREGFMTVVEELGGDQTDQESRSALTGP
jgi:hypothetical protein